MGAGIQNAQRLKALGKLSRRPWALQYQGSGIMGLVAGPLIGLEMGLKSMQEVADKGGVKTH
jgi:hypothetical protein